MNRSNSGKIVIGLVVACASVTGALAESFDVADPAKAPLPVQADNLPTLPAEITLTPIEQFAGVASMLNEVEDRRRRVVYTAYPSSVNHGVQHGFVHVSDGSAAFAKTDLVANAAMPIVIRRTYLSARDGASDFGAAGWRLTISEQIVPDDDSGGYRYIYGNNLGIPLDRKGNFKSQLILGSTDIVAIKISRRSAIVRLRTGITKNFEKAAGEFRIRAVEDDFGNRHDFEYSNGRLSEIRSNDDVSVVIRRDEAGQFLSVVESDLRTVTYGYDERGLLRAVVDLRSETWNYHYDQNRYLTTARTPMGTDDLSFVHDESGRVTNANVNGFAYDYVYAAQRTQVSDENGRSVRFVSNDDGLTTDVENWLGTVTSIETDSAGRPRVLRRNNQVESSVDYGSNRNNASPRSQYIRSPENGEPITIAFDKYGRVKAVESPDKISTLRISDYYAGLVPKLTSFGDGTSTHIELDETGYLKKYIDRSGRELLLQRTELGVELSFDDKKAQLAFGAMGELSELIAPDGESVKFTYDSGGLRESTRTSSGIAIDYRYDASGSLFYTEAGFNEQSMESFVYEIGPERRLQEISGSAIDGQHVFNYTLDGRVDSINSSITNDFSFLYDDAGRLETVIATGYEPYSYQYKPGEPDLVAQLDSRTRAIFNQQREVSEYNTRFNSRYSRVMPSQIGVLTYDERLAEIVPAVAPHRWSPAESFATALENIKLQALFAEDGPDLQSFSMPSSRLFIPAEYWSVNCCFCCPPSYIQCEIP